MANYLVNTPDWSDTPELKEYVLSEMKAERWGRALKALRILQQRGEHEFVEARFDFVLHYAAVSDDLLTGFTTPRPPETDTLVFGPPAGLAGIGDNLIFSTVPAAARASGYKKILLTNTHGLSGEVFDFVWGKKEGIHAIDGVTDEPPTNNQVWMWDILQSVYSPKRNLSMLQRVCMSYGLDPRLSHDTPIVDYYYKYNKELHDRVKNRVVIDVGTNSASGRFSSIDPSRVIAALEDIGIDDFCIVKPKNPSEKWGCIEIPDREVIECDNIEDYANVVEFSDRFLTISNGGYWIAGALRKGDQVKKTWHIEVKGAEQGYPSWMTLPFSLMTC